LIEVSNSTRIVLSQCDGVLKSKSKKLKLKSYQKQEKDQYVQKSEQVKLQCCYGKNQNTNE